MTVSSAPDVFKSPSQRPVFIWIPIVAATFPGVHVLQSFKKTFSRQKQNISQRYHLTEPTVKRTWSHWSQTHRIGGVCDPPPGCDQDVLASVLSICLCGISCIVASCHVFLGSLEKCFSIIFLPLYWPAAADKAAKRMDLKWPSCRKSQPNISCAWKSLSFAATRTGLSPCDLHPGKVGAKRGEESSTNDLPSFLAYYLNVEILVKQAEERQNSPRYVGKQDEEETCCAQYNVQTKRTRWCLLYCIFSIIFILLLY